MLQAIGPALRQFIDAPDPEPRKRGGQCRTIDGMPATQKQRSQKRQAARNEDQKRYIAILDFETDPFDNDKETHIIPFLAVLYSDEFEPVIIWEENEDAFTASVVRAIEGLRPAYTIYAHNGGKFDYMFLLHRMRGAVSFKGRGIMQASVGCHRLRDSYHIIPERLANIQKEKFDYANMAANRRGSYREEIIAYCISDCRYLLEIVKAFVNEFGIKLSIGQAAMSKLKETYDVAKLTDGWDQYLRQYYFGGRVECLLGAGDFVGDYKLYDVNSMYPYVMASKLHPIGDFHSYTLRHGVPSNDTVFIDLECNNNGALVARTSDGATRATVKQGRFFTTIHEYEVACRHNLISSVRINYCLDCATRSDFSLFVHPLYERRQLVKSELKALKKAGKDNGQYWHDLRKDDIFLKLLLNNAYGKFAQNPRNFKEYYLTDPDQLPPVEWMKSFQKSKEKELYDQPHYESERYWIWQKPCPRYSFHNVGTAASITGAARAMLLDAIHHAVEPIYCDTDSIICKGLSGVLLDPTALGAWDLEDEFTQVLIAGKKLYSVMHATPKTRSLDDLARGMVPEYTVKSKGTSSLTWPDLDCMLHGAGFKVTNPAPTLTRYGKQDYIKRTIRATAVVRD
jgi:DNA polymerase type B, organellar and viral